MKVIINNNLEIPEVSKIHETIDESFKEAITFVSHFSNEIFENIKNYLKNNHNIDIIEVYKDGELIKTFLKYKEFKQIVHRTTYGEIIELTFGVIDE